MNDEKKIEDKKIDDIVAMLDEFTSNDGGHMNIKVEDGGDVDFKIVDTHNTKACAKGTACQVPTFFDKNEEE